MSVPSAARSALTLSIASLIVFVGLASGVALLVPSSAQAATCPAGAAAIQSVSYTLNGSAGIRTVSDLTGNVNQGDIVTVTFTVKSICSNGVQFSVVSYLAPGPTWDPNTAGRQEIFNEGSAVGQPGVPTSLTITVPPGCFQIDFVGGTPLAKLDPSTGMTYSAQNRLIDFDNGDPGCLPLV
jgi:hypothetical protein